MMRKLMEMQSKTPSIIPIANPNQNLIRIPLAKSKGKEVGRKEFDEKSSFHQEPPSRASRGEIGFSDGGTTEREFYCGGDGVVNHYERFFWRGEWTIGEGEGCAETRESGHVRQMEENWEFHPRYMRETWRDHDNRYTGGGRSCWGGGNPKVRKLKM
ncbi:hypothetical protein IEQ34_017760 [Dendrobium chrysotoxum]|uniref:Uncharacterized protein n=1 Tax=Dendrobium chrysotoxum TaxID=161865 RepID=A0AAV7GAI3_DENCH|nr:hypothetical protein IEQ34_017760 [Dendrobium chrysotoxum]